MSSGPATLRRNRARSLVAGVCAGFADYLGTEAALVRTALVAFALFFPQIAGLGYAMAWILMRP